MSASLRALLRGRPFGPEVDMLPCFSCGEVQVRRRQLEDGYRWRCRRCGKGWGFRRVALDAPLPTSKPRPLPPPIEADLDWMEVAAA